MPPTSVRPGTFAPRTTVPVEGAISSKRVTYDLAWSYELLNFFQHGQHVDERGVSSL